MIDTSVSLRQYVRADRQALADLFGDAEVVRYVGDGKPLGPADAQALMSRIFDIYETDPSFFVWAVQEGDEYAGHAELKRRKGSSEYELIYLVQRSRWGRSLGGRIADLLIEEARRRSLPFVIATVHPDNLASIAILTRRGFERDVKLSNQLGAHAYRLNLAQAG